MLTIEIEPKELINQIRNIMKIFKWMICEMFDKEIKDNWGERKDDEPNAMVFKFSLKKHPQKYLDIVLFAPANYVYVFTRLKNNMSGSYHYEFMGEWNFETCHDSCWRDRIDGILSDHEEHLESVQFISSYSKIKISDKIYKKFREVREKCYGSYHNENRRFYITEV